MPPSGGGRPNRPFEGGHNRFAQRQNGFNNDRMGGAPNRMFGNQYDNPQNQQDEQKVKNKDAFDAGIEVAGKAAKGAGKGIVAFTKSFKNADSTNWQMTGKLGATLSISYVVGATLLWVVAFFTKLNTAGLGLQIAGGLLSLAVCTYLWLAPVENAIRNGEIDLDDEFPDVSEQEEEDDDNEWESGSEPSKASFTPPVVIENSDKEDETPTLLLEEDEPSITIDTPEDNSSSLVSIDTPEISLIEAPTVEIVDNNDIAPSFEGISKDMLTRSFLFEQAIRNLPHANRGYLEWSQVPSTSVLFGEISRILTICGDKVGGLDENGDHDKRPQIKEDSVRKNSYITEFTYTVSSKSPLMGKEDKLVKYFKEQWAIYLAEQEGLSEPLSSISAKYLDRLGDIRVQIIDRGNAKSITIGDAWEANKDALLATNLQIPLILGVTDEGEANFMDVHKIASMILGGMPESGKTTTLISLMVQLALLNSPKEIQFDVCDPKLDKTSSYAHFGMPHIHTLVHGIDDTIAHLKYLRDVEAKERSAILGKYSALMGGEPSWFNFYKAAPTKRHELPLKIVLIDEYNTFSSDMDRGKEFESIVKPLVTQLRSIGVFLWLVPHRVSHAMIDKNISSNVAIRGLVTPDREAQMALSPEGDSKTIVDTYNKGDCVFWAPADKVYDKKHRSKSGKFFSKTIIPAVDNTKQVTDYVCHMWHNIDPEGFHAGNFIDSAESSWSCDCEYRKKGQEKPKVDVSKPELSSSSVRDEVSSRVKPEEKVNMFEEASLAMAKLREKRNSPAPVEPVAEEPSIIRLPEDEEPPVEASKDAGTSTIPEPAEEAPTKKLTNAERLAAMEDGDF